MRTITVTLIPWDESEPYKETKKRIKLPDRDTNTHWDQTTIGGELWKIADKMKPRQQVIRYTIK